MAVKIVRQPNKIALLGAPTSAAALAPGHEKAPAALRAAGLIERLRAAGYDVTDMGDDHPQLFQPDEESPRARNLSGVLKALEALKPRVEQAIKSGALPLVLGGDCSIALAVIAAMHRYYRSVGAIYMDRDADLNTPATTPSGCIDGMVVAHLTGRGAAELVRFWGEPPLIREPDIALFGVDRLDPPEEELLRRSPIQRYLAADVQRMGPAVAAQTAIERIHGTTNEFLLHFDLDVIADFGATNFPGSGGLRLDEVRQALEVFARQKHMAALEVTVYNPDRDADGSAAKTVVDLVVHVLTARLEALAAPPAAAPAPQEPAPTAAPPPAEPASGQTPAPEEAAPGQTPPPEEPTSGQAESSLAATASAPPAAEAAPASSSAQSGPEANPENSPNAAAPASESFSPVENPLEPDKSENN